MSAKIVNLRQARKAKVRDEHARTGAENAARFGRSKAQKANEAREAAKSRAQLDAHKRDDG